MGASSLPSGRMGTPGLDVFKIAGQSISGFLPSFKTGNPQAVRQPFTSQLEERLALYLEYHPHVRTYQRGDASPSFAAAHRLEAPLGTPYRITYSYEGKVHDYLPDFVGTLSDGGCSSPRRDKTAKSASTKPLRKLMPLCAWPPSTVGATGLAPSESSHSAATTTSCSCITAGSRFRPTPRLQTTCQRSGSGGSPPAWSSSSGCMVVAGPNRRSRPPFGSSPAMPPLQGTCW
jgi:hypothetical protein